MELRHLRYFRAVAESKGFREAARRLHVVQPALSQTVSDLERELGVRLLTRNSRSVRLTSEGEVFLKEAKEILAHADRSVELARGAARGEIGSLSVGFLGSATAFFLPRIIRDYRRRFPSVRLTLREMAPAPQIDEFRAGRLDVGFTRPISAADETWLRSECLYRDSLLAVLPKGHGACARAVVSVQQLADEPFVLFHRAGAPELFDAIVGRHDGRLLGLGGVPGMHGSSRLRWRYWCVSRARYERDDTPLSRSRSPSLGFSLASAPGCPGPWRRPRGRRTRPT